MNLAPAAYQQIPLSQVATATAPKTEDTATLAMLVRYFEESENSGREARERSERCRDYYNNKQWTDAEVKALKKRGQAPIYVNYIQRKVDTLCGLERRARTDPKAFPRNPDDEKASEAATDALRFVADQNKFNGVRSQVYNDILVEGYGAVDVTAEQNASGDIDVKLTQISWDRIFYDPHSRKLDFSDAKYKGVVIWMDKSDAEADYPDYIDSITDTLASTSASETFDDRPKWGIWTDSKRTRVRVVQIHYKYDGEWWLATFTKGGFLVPPVVSPYVDKDGTPVCSMSMRAAYVDRENDRYGHVEGLIPLQDEINKRRSKGLHLYTVRQTFGTKSALVDTQAARTELAKPDGHVELNDGMEYGKQFGTIDTGAMAQGQFLMLQQALGEMNATGANAAMQGKDDKAPSGVALKAKIQAGSVELEPLADGLREWTKEVFEAMWMRIRQFWTEEKWVRVTDDEKNLKWVGLNKKITLNDKLGTLEPEHAAAIARQLQLQPNDPRLQQVVEVENNVSGLDVDIVIDEQPDVASLQSEQFEQLVQLAGSPLSQGQIPFSAIIKASSLRNKDAILEDIEKHQAQASQAQAQQQQEAHALGVAEGQAKVANIAATTDLNKAKTEQVLVKTHIDGLNALSQALAGYAPQQGFGPAAGVSGVSAAAGQ